MADAETSVASPYTISLYAMTTTTAKSGFLVPAVDTGYAIPY